MRSLSLIEFSNSSPPFFCQSCCTESRQGKKTIAFYALTFPGFSRMRSKYALLWAFRNRLGGGFLLVVKTALLLCSA